MNIHSYDPHLFTEDNNAPVVGDHISPVDKEGASHNGEDNELPGDKDNMEDDEDDEKDVSIAKIQNIWKSCSNSTCVSPIGGTSPKEFPF